MVFSVGLLGMVFALMVWAEYIDEWEAKSRGFL